MYIKFSKYLSHARPNVRLKFSKLEIKSLFHQFTHDPCFFEVALDLQQIKNYFQTLKNEKNKITKNTSHIASPKGAMCTIIYVKNPLAL